jgi:hypothetical protein
MPKGFPRAPAPGWVVSNLMGSRTQAACRFALNPAPVWCPYQQQHRQTRSMSLKPVQQLHRRHQFDNIATRTYGAVAYTLVASTMTARHIWAGSPPPVTPFIGVPAEVLPNQIPPT